MSEHSNCKKEMRIILNLAPSTDLIDDPEYIEAINTSPQRNYTVRLLSSKGLIKLNRSYSEITSLSILPAGRTYFYDLEAVLSFPDGIGRTETA